MEAQKFSNFSYSYRESWFISRLFYLWIIPLISYANKSKGIDDNVILPEMPSELSALEITQKLEKKFKRAKEENTKAGTSFIIMSSIFKTFSKELILLLLLRIGSDVIAITNIFLTSYLIEWLKDDDAEEWAGYFYIVLISSLMLITATIQNYFFFRASCVGLAIRKGISGLLYKKVLKFTQKSRAKATSGKLVTIVSGELQFLEKGLVTLPNMITGPITLIFWFWLISTYFSEAVIFGVLLSVLIVVLQFFSSQYINSCKYNEGYYSDKRLNALSEAINGIRTVKVYAWEMIYLNLINKYRIKMVDYLHKNHLTESVMWGISTNGGYLIAIVIFGYHYWVGRSFKYEESLVTFAILGLISYKVFQPMFMGFDAISNFRAILKRVGEVLDMEECNFEDNSSSADITEEEDDIRICMKNWSFVWGESLNKEDEANTGFYEDCNLDLKNITFEAYKGDLVVIAGAIGSGKSTFLAACMNELRKVHGFLEIKGKIAYVKQDPFVIPGSVKDNILFGNEYDESKFEQAISICMLENDIEKFDQGVDTLIGEEGLNLSGGQKARISLARAIYSDAEIILLDDPLSAIDPIMTKIIYDKCITGYMKTKLVILATHQIQYIKNAN